MKTKCKLDFPEMNKTESRFADQLSMLKHTGSLSWYEYEAIKLKLAPKTFYTPDFVAVDKTGQVIVYEVKGGFIRDDAIVKLKIAARLFPMFRFKLCQWKNKQWKITQLFP